jgi:AraC-like DNA-binding protein
MEKVSTIGLPPAGRTAAWNDIYSSHMSRVEFTPGDQHSFGAELSIGRLGPVKLAKLSVDRCSIERNRGHLTQSPRLYSFLLQAAGSSVFSHYGREARLSEGDFVLCDTGMPHHFHTGNPSMTIMVRVTPEVLTEYMPSPERFCGLQLGRAVGVTHTAAAMVRSLSEQVAFRSGRYYEARIARHLLEMISIAYSIGFEDKPTGSAGAWRRRNDIIRYIEDHLHDPSLTVNSVAEGLGLSARHLRTLFSESGEKLSAYILRRRLEECARRMSDPAWRGETLMKIAFSRGFNSAAHFTRTFRDHFKVGPREYRRGVKADQPI